MPQLRQNPATKEWVIIATERAKRPEDFGRGIVPVNANEKEKCPFCPGRESQTPAERLAFRPYGSRPNSPGWWVRVIPNAFPALLPIGNNERQKCDDFYSYMEGMGMHEVIIESPEHEAALATMDQKQVEEVFLAYRQRYLELASDKRYEMVILFKNYGPAAGTSLYHPHSQIVAIPITPLHIRNRIEQAMHYFDDNGTCVYCDMISKEKKTGERLVLESDNYIVFEPFASRSPFETMIAPKKHSSSFENITTEATKELASVVRQTLAKIRRALNNPDYNLLFRSAPVHEQNVEYFHWHIQILPRVSAVAGFELGSGIYINTMIPETAAKFLCETQI
ncbi:galactose-1-phosphate uridylyltransferase [candidate division WOR-1 bacterium RIFOXYB2_FULL_48_7]|uniref:Galactose-1-phosphate uridylyltransferase n=1 Tax=candidate division WOR-1 bacterium RIFOXYB2_FULL_48_7 TaxID=1802583 RepID=A0A1F4TTU9_UNCSA|nr:MAG: galactose-1-phosphate uridylyltransferase [candidate division WOR-1 bacterium RIFOXYB2_FULL_48_7]